MSTIEFFKRKPGYCGAKVLIPPVSLRYFDNQATTILFLGFFFGLHVSSIAPEAPSERRAWPFELVEVDLSKRFQLTRFPNYLRLRQIASKRPPLEDRICGGN
jgi:hypothetical protein